MILSMKVLLLGAAVTTATATATAQGTTRTTGTERTVHAGDHVTTITVDGTPTTITNDVKSVTAAPGAKVKVTAAPPQQGKRARLVITKAASSSSGQGGSGNGGDSGQGGQLQNIPVRGIEIFNPTGGTVFFVGTSYQFNAKVLPENATNKSVSWSVSDLDASGENTTETNNYATIDDSGLLDCLAAGKVRIFAMSEHNNSIVGTCDIEVKDPNAGGSGQQGGENGGGDQPQTGENGGGQGTGEVTPVVNPGGQGTGQDTPGGQGEEQLSSKIGTENGHYLVINFPEGKEKLKQGETITLSATDNSLLLGVSWSTIPSYATLSAAAAFNSIKFSCDVPGTVRVTATLRDNPDVTAYQDFQIVE